MESGDLVKILTSTSWGGTSDTGKSGTLIKRTYLSYERQYCKWDILMTNNQILNISEKNLKVINESRGPCQPCNVS